MKQTKLLRNEQKCKASKKQEDLPERISAIKTNSIDKALT